MNVNLKNYRNINELNLELDEGKVNFIYGMSGSGKSSIAKALLGEIGENNIPYGKTSKDVFIKLNPIINKEDCSIFDENTQKQLLINRDENNNMFSIIFAEKSELDEIENDISTLLSRINSKRESLLRYVSNVEKMIKKINHRSMSKKGKFSSSSSIEKIKSEIINPKYKTYYNFIHNNGLEYVEWIEKGATFPLYNDNKCPFCSRKLSESKKEKIKTILEIKPEQYSIIVDSQDILNDIGISVPNFSYKREINKLEQELYDAYNNELIINNIYNMVDSYSSNMLNIKEMEKIKLSNSLKELFPDFEEIINEFNDNLKEIKIKFSKYKSKTSKIVANNLKKLNDQLKLFSIKYEFSIGNYDVAKQKATVFLKSTKDKYDIDRTENLSYGEKNFIALLLFLLSNTKKYVVIDDPASSYDENRRKNIYELFYDFHNKKTFLVLSHDQVFIKYAILGIKDKRTKKYIDNTGKIICLENNLGNCLSKNISVDDFGALNSQINDFIKNTEMPYYRMIMNLRLLAETSKSLEKNDKIVYEYLSAILHRCCRACVQDELKKKEITEKEVLNIIYDKYKIRLKMQPDDIFEGFNYDDLTNFEKVIYKREEEKLKRENTGKRKKSYLEKEFDDIVHLNNKYFISLNPYLFNIFSECVYQNI
ncbi:MAG: hypothetical protein PUG33_07550 [Mollicutes bacterium]|nr:hypothetical protein [Mollicutes bacterium]